MAEYDNTNSGALYSMRDHYEVVRQGKINIDGTDQRVIAVKRNNKAGEPIVELYRSIGTIKRNENKTQDKHPDSRGMIESLSQDSVKSIAAWKKVSKAGNEFISVAISEIQRPDQDKAPVDDDPLDDDIPF
tara:strand:- start:1334 stop:1726 length:393 start_codon:yes stop_codon:yes gene_type:complete